MIVRPEQPGDVPAVRNVVEAAFGGERVPRLLDAMRESDAWRDLSFVAEDAGEIVGHVCFTRGWVDAPLELVEVLVLSPLSVRPDRQRTGVGRQLVAESIAGLDTPLVFLEGDPAYYGRLGFVAGESLGFTAPSVRIAGGGFQVMPRPSYDASFSGALVYPDVFWRHDSVGLRLPT